MKRTKKLIIIAVITVIVLGGILGGVAAWPLTELIVEAQARFPSYLLFVGALGGAVGLLMGAFFGSAAGSVPKMKMACFGGTKQAISRKKGDKRGRFSR